MREGTGRWGRETGARDGETREGARRERAGKGRGRKGRGEKVKEERGKREEGGSKGEKERESGKMGRTGIAERNVYTVTQNVTFTVKCYWLVEN